MERIFSYRMNRRTLLGAAAALGIGTLVLRNGSGSELCAAPAVAATATSLKHNMWVWRFDVDGSPDEVLNRIRDAGMGVLLKTSDGADWMSRFDRSSTAISGPEKVREMANYFESAGIPFHAWSVVKGLNPVREAEICSQVLDNGARSMIFDLEPPEGNLYWQADSAAAVTFGQEMRRLQPNAHLGVAPDARPWQIPAVPLAEFSAFCDEILPQTYWQTFNSPTNRRFISERGYHVGPEGVTPELILDVTRDALAPFGLPVRPIGQGAASGPEWERFVRHAYTLNMDSVSVWRYGTAHQEVWPTLGALAPAVPVVEQPEPQQAPEEAAEASEEAPSATEPAEAPVQDTETPQASADLKTTQEQSALPMSPFSDGAVLEERCDD